MNDTVVFYNGERVSVPKEVAEFLEKDRKRAQAQARQDKRHLSRSEFETVLSSHVSAGRPLEQSVLWNLRLENLREAVEELSVQEQEILYRDWLVQIVLFFQRHPLLIGHIYRIVK